MTTPIATIFYDVIDSTNAEARRRAEEGQSGPLWIAASRQTAGRGRRGRTWESPTGNLAATLLLTTDKPPAEAAQVSFVAALAAADAICEWIPPSLVRVKWPNDVMIGDEKVCGILVESGRTANEGLWLAIGVGINLASPPEVTERPATSFAAQLTAPPPSMEEALEVLAGFFEEWLGLWSRLGFGPIADSWTARAYGLGQPCTARLANESIEGIAEGLDEDGSLRLRLADGTHRRVTAGDVFVGAG